jgi:splicing factor U2AF 65 kDa subunit
LTSMVTKEELIDPNEYEEIVEDVTQECSKHGTVLAVIIPRSIDGYPLECEGSVYVEFETKDMAKVAASALSGRKFEERIVVVLKVFI